MIRRPARVRHELARALASIAAIAAIVAGAAACGSTGPTPTLPPTPSPSPTLAVTASPTPAPTPTPLPAIYPVPTTVIAPPAAAPIQLTSRTAAALQATIDRIRTRGAIPGLSVAVVFADGSAWTGQSGAEVRTTGKKVTLDTLFSVGSITKTFTGAMALRLAERDVIGLDDPLSKYLPSYPNASKITIRMLMDHTSGIRDLFDTSVFKSIDANHSKRWTPEQTLAIAVKPYFRPGSGYHYSSTNYILLGQVIEKATGERLVDLVRSEFLAPLGLSHTFLQWEENPRGTLAHGYAGSAAKPRDLSTGQTLVPYASEATAVGAGGGIVSTASDVARWSAALYGGGVLDPASLTSLTDVSATSRFKPRTLYGLGFERLIVGNRVAWGHGGHLDGFKSMMAYFPSSGISVAVLTNADWINPLTSVATIYAAIPGAA